MTGNLTKKNSLAHNGKAILIVFFLVAQVFLTENVSPQTFPDFRGHGSRILDYQFEKADRELSPERWMEEARRGIDNALTVLAEMIPEIFVEPETEKAFAEWTEDELEKRFTRWLLERFFGTGVEAPVSALLSEISEADKFLIYHTGSGGNILYDPLTGDPKIIRQGDDGHDFSADLSLWREQTALAAEREVQSYEAEINGMYPELLVYIPAERKEQFRLILAASAGTAVNSVKNEFEAMLAREERYFTAMRLGDVLSLRKKSEDESAGEIVSALIENTGRVCDNAIALIETKIEAARNEGGDLTLSGFDWLEEFQNQFRRGLDAWESAEERFLIHRVEWEQSAEKTFNNGIQEWHAAFLRLEEERNKWEYEARRLFVEGEEFFAASSASLENAIASAKSEFERSGQLMAETAFERTKAVSNIYTLSSNAVSEAEKNIAFWSARYTEINPSASIPRGFSELETWAEEELLGIEEDAAMEKLALEELKNWLVLYKNYSVKQEESRERLLNELYMVTVSQNGMGEGIYPDNYETELLRAEAELTYWQNRRVIAESVAAYAEALDAGRTTAAESFTAWESAKRNYDQAALSYAGAENLLKASAEEADAAREFLETAAEQLEVAEATLKSLRHDYQVLVGAFENSGKNRLEAELDIFQKNYASTQELLSRIDESSPWGAFFSIARTTEIARLEELRKDLLEMLIAGQDGELKALSELAEEAANGIYENHSPLFIYIEQLKEESAISEARYNSLFDILTGSSKIRAQSELEQRLAAISLFVENNSGISWYCAVNNINESEIAGLETAGLEKYLFDEWEIAKTKLLLGRLELELAAFDFLSGTESGDKAELLSVFYDGDENTIANDRGILVRVLNLVNSLTNSGAPLSDMYKSLSKISLNDAELLFFLEGGSLINSLYGRAIEEALLPELASEAEFSDAVHAIYAGVADLSPRIAGEKTALALEGIKNYWSTEGIVTWDRFIPDADEIINTTSMYVDSEQAVFDLISGLDEYFYRMPEWPILSFNMWKENFTGYYRAFSSEALGDTERLALILDQALSLLATGDYTEDASVVFAEARQYIDNPLMEWDESIFTSPSAAVSEEYETALNELLGHYSAIERCRTEMRKINGLLSLVNNEGRGIESRVESASLAVTHAEDNYRTLVNEYSEAAGQFDRTIAAYNARYTEMENAFIVLEEAKLEFEKQEAIRHWAETSYLDSRVPINELNHYNTMESRALHALEMLRDLPVRESAAATEEYDDAGSDYKNSLELYTLALAAFNKFNLEAGDAALNNSAAHMDYQTALSNFGKNFLPAENYVSPADRSLWSIIDMVTVDAEGYLRFSRDENYRVSGMDEERYSAMKEYFSPNIIIDNEPYPVSSFELALRKLSEYFPDDSFSENDYQGLGLARDQLIKTIIDNNPESNKIHGWYRTAESLRYNTNLGMMKTGTLMETVEVYEMANYHAVPLVASEQASSWNSLSEEARRNLEFYTILTLTGAGGNNSEYFSRVSERREFNYVYWKGHGYYSEVVRKKNWPFVGWLYIGCCDIARATQNALAISLNELNNMFSEGYSGLTETLKTLNAKFSDYTESSERLAMLAGKRSEPVSWDDIENTLEGIADFNVDIVPLKSFWHEITENNGNSFSDISEALRFILERARGLKEESYYNLSRVWGNGNREQEMQSASFRVIYNNYLQGNVSPEYLANAALLSFGKTVPSEKEHLNNLGTYLVDTLSLFEENNLSGTEEFASLVDEFAGIVKNAWGGKNRSELAARMDEWTLQRRNISEKLLLWREQAGIILEHGRLAWKEGETELTNASNAWVDRFQSEYRRISDNWNSSCLEGLRNKEAWAKNALETVSRTSSSAMLAMVSAGAEAGARAMDTTYPFDLLNVPDINEGAKIISGLLEKAGTNYLFESFNTIASSRDSVSFIIRSGLGRERTANYTFAINEALETAKNLSDVFEARESKKMAYIVMDRAKTAWKTLEDNIRFANENFKKSMDETFIIGGQWRRSGNNYIKDVIVHSTLLNSVITEFAETPGYNYFVTPEASVLLRINDNSLRNLDAFQAGVLIDSVFSEIDTITKRIFNSGTNGGEGEFLSHIGNPPAFKLSDNIDLDMGRQGLFSDFGNGEQGRLFVEFYFWMAREKNGLNAVSAAPWEKPIWDSRGSVIQAPSLKSAVNFAVQTGLTIAGAFTGGASLLGTIALGAGLNSVDDLVFSVLDVSAGYKSWKEAGVEFGKQAAMNVVNSAASAVFSGIKESSSTFLKSGGVNGLVNNADFGSLTKYTLNTAATGLQTAATGTINSAIASVIYSDENGFDFSKDNFLEGLKSTGKNALSGLTGKFAENLMNFGIEGFRGNVSDNARSLSRFSGGAASQGINRAFGDDFVFNVLDIGVFSGGNRNINAGVLELHLGKNGIKFELGGGGVDASITSVISAVKGLEAWKANFEIWTSGTEASGKYTSSLRTLYSGGEENRRLYGEILNGETLVVETERRETETIRDSSSGLKTIYLGRDAFNTGGEFGLNVYFSHESYRDGVVRDEVYMAGERDRAVLGHMDTAAALYETYGRGSLGGQMELEARIYMEAMRSGDFSVVNAMMDLYDDSGSFWKLTQNGDLVYDGLATLTDHLGRTLLSLKSMGLKSEAPVESALIRILGLNSSNSADVSTARSLMVRAGLVHSLHDDPDQWFWVGAHDSKIFNEAGYIQSGIQDLTAINMGRTITLSHILTMYDYGNLSDSSGAMKAFIGNAFGSADEMYSNYPHLAGTLLKRTYTEEQLALIMTNRSMLNYYTLHDTIDIERVVLRHARQTQSFEEKTEMLELVSSSVDGAEYFNEIHTGIDLVAPIGTPINVPFGFWEYTSTDDNGHSGYFQLFGTSLRMRIQHMDTEVIKNMVPGTIYGGTNSRIFSFPSELYGASSGLHAHIDMTTRLLYGDRFERQFVNPRTLEPGADLEFSYAYLDAQKNHLEGYPRNFIRY